jgi:uncharacterized caspase-like protein
LIHFATRPGSVAADGTGSNGLYTSQLLRFIDAPDVPVETMLKRMSAAVTRREQTQQHPRRVIEMQPEVVGVSVIGGDIKDQTEGARR